MNKISTNYNNNEYQESDIEEQISNDESFQFLQQNSYIYPIDMDHQNEQLGKEHFLNEEKKSCLSDPVDFHDNFTNNNFLTINTEQFEMHSSDSSNSDEYKQLLIRYNQKKEELSVHKQITAARENREQALQDELNQVTIKLAQLRIISDDLTSSLKISEAHNQYLKNKLKKMESRITKNDEKNHAELIKLKSIVEIKQNDINNLKKSYDLMCEKFKSENKELKTLLISARNQTNSFQDENFKISNEARSILTQLETEKSEKSYIQKNLNELKVKYEKVSNDLIQFKHLIF